MAISTNQKPTIYRTRIRAQTRSFKAEISIKITRSAYGPIQFVQYELIFTHLKLWIAAAMHNIK